MTIRSQQPLGVFLMLLGPVLLLCSPWLVLNFPMLHARVYDEGWAILVDGGCEWVSTLNEAAAVRWVLVLALVGVAGLTVWWNTANEYRKLVEVEGQDMTTLPGPALRQCQPLWCGCQRPGLPRLDQGGICP